MKIRNGFVSNSSTTSFCIYGTTIDRDEEDFDEQCDIHELECHSSPYDYSTWYVGISWAHIKDDETGAQFKKRIESKLSKLFGVDPQQCCTLEMAWRDG